MIDKDLLPKTSPSSFSALLDLGDYCTPFHLITCILEIGLHKGYNKKYPKYVGYRCNMNYISKKYHVDMGSGFCELQGSRGPFVDKNGGTGTMDPSPPPPLARRSLKSMDRLGSP